MRHHRDFGTRPTRPLSALARPGRLTSGWGGHAAAHHGTVVATNVAPPTTNSASRPRSAFTRRKPGLNTNMGVANDRDRTTYISSNNLATVTKGAGGGHTTSATTLKRPATAHGLRNNSQSEANLTQTLQQIKAQIEKEKIRLNSSNKRMEYRPSNETGTRHDYRELYSNPNRTDVHGTNSSGRVDYSNPFSRTTSEKIIGASGAIGSTNFVTKIEGYARNKYYDGETMNRLKLKTLARPQSATAKYSSGNHSNNYVADRVTAYGGTATDSSKALIVSPPTTSIGGTTVLGGEAGKILGPALGNLKRPQSAISGIIERPQSAVSRTGGNGRRPQSASLNKEKVESESFSGYYTCNRTIGQGAYAVVKSAQHHPSTRNFAIKIFDKTRSNWESRKKLVYREVKLMQRICRPNNDRGNENICHFIEFLDTPAKLNLILDEVNGGNLRQELNKKQFRRLTEPTVRSFFYQICNGISYLHQNLVVHRDIKLENLLIHNLAINVAGTGQILPPAPTIITHSMTSQCGTTTVNTVSQPITSTRPGSRAGTGGSGKVSEFYSYGGSSNSSSAETFQQIKIVDFGFAVKLQSPQQKLKVFCGTPSYMSPEIVSNKEYSGFQSDVWALGVVLYVLLHGRFPFKASQEHELYHKIKRGQFSLNDNTIGGTPKRVIKGILRVDPTLRPVVHQILAHDWVAAGVPDDYILDHVHGGESGGSVGENGCGGGSENGYGVIPHSGHSGGTYYAGGKATSGHKFVQVVSGDSKDTTSGGGYTSGGSGQNSGMNSGGIGNSGMNSGTIGDTGGKGDLSDTDNDIGADYQVNMSEIFQRELLHKQDALDKEDSYEVIDTTLETPTGGM